MAILVVLLVIVDEGDEKVSVVNDNAVERNGRD